MEKEKRNIFSRLFQRRSAAQVTHTTFAKLPIDMRCELAGFWATRAMNSPEVLTVVNTIAEIFSTIPTYHKRTDDKGNIEYIEKDIHRVLNIDPNPLQNKTQFWINVVTQWLLNNNVVILPEWGTRWDERQRRDIYTLRSLVPLPNTAARPQKDGDGSYFIDITIDGVNKRYDISELIILNRFSTLNGGGSNQPISLHQSIMQSILKQAEQQAISPKTIQAYLQIKTGNMKGDAAEARRKEILDQLVNKTDGELPIVSIQSDVELKTIDIKDIPINKDILLYAQKGAYNFFGFTDEALQRKMTAFEWQLLISTTFRPLVNMASEEFTRKIFSPREKEMRNAIEFDLTALQVNTLSEITNYMRIAIPHAVNTPNEIRDLGGWGIKKNGLGDNFFTTLNMIEEINATEYKLLMAKNGLLATMQNDTSTTNKEDDNDV